MCLTPHDVLTLMTLAWDWHYYAREERYWPYYEREGCYISIYGLEWALLVASLSYIYAKTSLKPP